jgi:hypothetical protein
VEVGAGRRKRTEMQKNKYLKYPHNPMFDYHFEKDNIYY